MNMKGREYLLKPNIAFNQDVKTFDFQMHLKQWITRPVLDWFHDSGRQSWARSKVMVIACIVHHSFRKSVKSWESVRKWAKSWETVLKVERVCLNIMKKHSMIKNGRVFEEARFPSTSKFGAIST